ncbi:hypothetical protein JHK87_049840 [Glycine soja]|nr:hypothetical protein JHK87_049840 [Glycine soja]
MTSRDTLLSSMRFDKTVNDRSPGRNRDMQFNSLLQVAWSHMQPQPSKGQDLHEVVEEIQDEFVTVSNFGKEVALLLEGGGLELVDGDV